MSTELATKYCPEDVEPRVAQRWESAGAFGAQPPGPDEPGVSPFCIVIPPPNVTAALHMGHALNNTLQDILVRWHRMAGDRTVWIPGTDHAGIATQTVVEKRLLAVQGKRRTDFERDVFVAKVQAWKDEYEERITDQLKKMGCSCDWGRQRFTMDPACTRAVREAFFELFKQGLIYRGKRLVNWDPATQTALADDEVEMREIDGHFWYLRYPLVDSVHVAGETYHHVTVATTRPETMLGDTAIAMNPKDPRARALVGKLVRLPIVNRIVPIIADDYVVLPDPDGDDPKARYATGFLKVTPAHDPNDWEIGLRHRLSTINVMATDASISDQYGWPQEDFSRGEAGMFLGLDRFEAREAIVDWFREHRLLEDVKPYRHSVGHSYRSHVPIEPYLSDQWYVRVTDDRMASAALRAMAGDQYQTHSEHATKRATQGKPWEGQLRFHPPRYAKTFQTWHENLRDWCISRQLWWGHRIPVWSYDFKDQVMAYFNENKRREIPTAFASLQKVLAEHPDKVATTFRGELPGVGSKPLWAEETFVLDTAAYVCLREDDPVIIDALESAGWKQEPDVLDTWFSSALWPLSTLGWPDDTPDLEFWNPTSVLCTAREIITLWVSRMVMMNLFLRGCLPFRDVFIHAMIQDGKGRKMSKSLGNGVDPLDIIQSHGSDAMRYTLAAMTTKTQDVRMPISWDAQSGHNTSDKFDLGRNFANKLWNAARFALQNLKSQEDSLATALEPGQAQGLDLADRWVLSRLATVVRDTETALEQYEFASYAQGLYDFFWRDLCDWYIEAIKPTVTQNATQRQILAACLDAVLRLLHPVMPFITETLWEHLNQVAPDRCGPMISGVDLPTSDLLIQAAWPRVDQQWIDPDAEAAFERVQQLVGAIRQVRTTHQVSPRQRVDVSGHAPPDLADFILQHQLAIQTLAQADLGQVGPEVTQPADATVCLFEQAKLFLHGLVDQETERVRLAKRLEDVDKSIHALNQRLSNKAYVDKAPAHLVQETRDQLSAAQHEAQSIQQQLAAMP